jgi:hypothetical protein
LATVITIADPNPGSLIGRRARRRFIGHGAPSACTTMNISDGDGRRTGFVSCCANAPLGGRPGVALINIVLLRRAPIACVLLQTMRSQEGSRSLRPATKPVVTLRCARNGSAGTKACIPQEVELILRHPGGFSYFVSSTAAPVASGWSVCQVGLAPTGKRRLVTAHTQLRHRTPWQSPSTRIMNVPPVSATTWGSQATGR